MSYTMLSPVKKDAAMHMTAEEADDMFKFFKINI
jgi:hypothetical protein